MKLKFLGGIKTVTGSKYLLEYDGKKTLIDCGLFQGRKPLRLLNWRPFSVDPSTIDNIILTHAHLDHSGYLPVLVKQGFRGRIYASAATRDLCSILLPDSGYLQEEEARWANKKGYSKHKPALPLYTKKEAEAVMSYFYSVEFGRIYPLSDKMTFQLSRAGHIVGASFIEIRENNTSLLFSGDIGRDEDPVMYPPTLLPGADYVVVESTYGNRLHKAHDRLNAIEKIVNDTVKRGGVILIPSFAVGRAQSLIYSIYQLKEAKRIPNIPVYLDSPMAINATDIFCDHVEEHKLTEEICEKVLSTVEYVNTPEHSRLIASYEAPRIIISASGMAVGGRILHHLKSFAGDPRNTILFAGYQAEGTRGARILHGEPEVKIHGKMVPIRAEVKVLNDVSAHADYQEILTWLSHFTIKPKKVFITHGELESAEALQAKIVEKFSWDCYVPEYLQTELL